MEQNVFEDAGYKWYKKDSADYIGISSRHYHLEVYLDALKLFTLGRETGISPTRVLVGGKWQVKMFYDILGHKSIILLVLGHTYESGIDSPESLWS